MFESNGVAITLGLPAYNEQDNIETVLNDSIAALNKTGQSWEVIVVDNCSSDETAARVRDYSKRVAGVKLIVHDRNRMYSGSCQTILSNAQGRYVSIMDSDGQFSAEDLPKFMKALDEGADLVFGWRKVRHDPLMRKVASAVFNFLAKFWIGSTIHDLNVGIRMFNRRFVEVAYLKTAINLANPELFVRAADNGLRVGEVPIRHAERNFGESCHTATGAISSFLKVNRYLRDLCRNRKPSTLGASKNLLNNKAA